jgi:exosortase
LILFHFLGNSILGYRATPSLYSWLSDKYANAEDNGHCKLIPFVVLALFWWKRKEILAVSKAPWWPASLLLGFALLMHVFGFLVQQTLISSVAFFIGIYAFMGMVWGFQMLKASFFPYFLTAFCIPLSGEPTEKITFPLRLLVTQISTIFSKIVLGINVIQDGTRIFDSSGSFQYEVAAACSGMRSLIAIFAMAMIYAFVVLKSPWRRLIMIAAAFPLAVIANVFRLTTIIFAAEAFGGQTAGNYVHESSWMSMLPYIPAIAGLFLCGHWLREDRAPRPRPQTTTPAEQTT